MRISVTRDLWSYLADTRKRVVMYGMGNGADKILAICAQKGIEVCDFFASDGFVRGHSFHGKEVLSFSCVKEKYGAENLIVLLSFGSSRPEVLENIDRIAAECELYVPDVPVFGEGLFDYDFYLSHKSELEAVYELLSDEHSRRLFESVIEYKLTGRLDLLRAYESDLTQELCRLVRPHECKLALDLGAYNGDSVRALLQAAENEALQVIAMEPDARNYKKLCAYAEGEGAGRVMPICAGAWSKRELLRFDASGNRNASFGENRSQILSDRPVKWKEIEAMPPDEAVGDRLVDYIKYDVEGAEREAIVGSRATIEKCLPTLLVSLYHRNEDLFDLPLLVHQSHPDYRGFYLRRGAGVPAWDLNLYVRKNTVSTED